MKTLLTLAIAFVATIDALAQLLPTPTPTYPTTVEFVSPVSTVALVGEAKAWDTPSALIHRVRNGHAAFSLATGEESFDSTWYGCPVTGLTPEDVAAEIAAFVAQPVTDAAKLAKAKAAKIKVLGAATAASLSVGVAVEGVTYGITDKDQANWLAALTALQNAQTVTGFNPAETDATALLGPLLDITGTPVGSVTVTAFRELMVELTSAVGAIRANHISKVAAINAAESVEDVNSIDL